MPSFLCNRSDVFEFRIWTLDNECTTKDIKCYGLSDNDNGGGDGGGLAVLTNIVIIHKLLLMTVVVITNLTILRKYGRFSSWTLCNGRCVSATNHDAALNFNVSVRWRFSWRFARSYFDHFLA